MDFTFKTYKQLLATLQSQGYLFQTVSDWCNESTHEKTILLRHDVEALYNHSLCFAEIQHARGIKGTYYFRLFPHSENGTTIGKIAELGHETGYHYDDLSICKGNYEEAMQLFQKNLAFLRSIAPVETIAMKGAPFSKYDNRELWGKVSSKKASNEVNKADKKHLTSYYLLHTQSQPGICKPYNYRDYGIECEPYFDLDFAKLSYLTDTGRRWDGKYAVRDKVTEGRRDEEMERRRD